MNGWPVWLASVTLRDRHDEIIPTETWSRSMLERANIILDGVLLGAGDPQRERSFRMCATLCRHRAVRDDEALRLPESWWTEAARDLAGGPVEVMWERGIPPTLSTQPCANPSWMPITPKLKAPLDCGDCESCRARAACVGRVIRRPK